MLASKLRKNVSCIIFKVKAAFLAVLLFIPILVPFTSPAHPSHKIIHTFQIYCEERGDKIEWGIPGTSSYGFFYTFPTHCVTYIETLHEQWQEGDHPNASEVSDAVLFFYYPETHYQNVTEKFHGALIRTVDDCDECDS